MAGALTVHPLCVSGYSTGKDHHHSARCVAPSSSLLIRDNWQLFIDDLVANESKADDFLSLMMEEKWRWLSLSSRALTRYRHTLAPHVAALADGSSPHQGLSPTLSPSPEISSEQEQRCGKVCWSA